MYRAVTPNNSPLDSEDERNTLPAFNGTPPDGYGVKISWYDMSVAEISADKCLVEQKANQQLAKLNALFTEADSSARQMLVEADQLVLRIKQHMAFLQLERDERSVHVQACFFAQEKLKQQESCAKGQVKSIVNQRILKEAKEQRLAAAEAERIREQQMQEQRKNRKAYNKHSSAMLREGKDAVVLDEAMQTTQGIHQRLDDSNRNFNIIYDQIIGHLVSENISAQQLAPMLAELVRLNPRKFDDFSKIAEICIVRGNAELLRCVLSILKSNNIDFIKFKITEYNIPGESNRRGEKDFHGSYSLLGLCLAHRYFTSRKEISFGVVSILVDEFGFDVDAPCYITNDGLQYKPLTRILRYSSGAMNDNIRAILLFLLDKGRDLYMTNVRTAIGSTKQHLFELSVRSGNQWIFAFIQKERPELLLKHMDHLKKIANSTVTLEVHPDALRTFQYVQKLAQELQAESVMQDAAPSMRK